MGTIRIGPHDVGPGQKCFVVAELGINHDGSVNKAVEMVYAAQEAGADAVKCQAFRPSCFVSKHATYKGESQNELFNRYWLTDDRLAVIAATCKRLGIAFFGTPDCEDHARLLLDLGAQAMKIGSDDLCNTPLIGALATLCGERSVPLILSTGMADEDEILDALEVCAPCHVGLLHCVSEYPCLTEHANLLRMVELDRNFLVDAIGYSDHTDGIDAAVAAVAMGAQIVEKHVTLDRSLPGPDHAFSADPAQLSAMVRRIREIETMLGSGDIEPSDEEKAMRIVARRSIRSRFDVPAGTLLTRGHLVFQRPGDGLSPARLDDVLGKSLCVPKAAGDNIAVEDVQ